jgi:hypothetical protein
MYLCTFIFLDQCMYLTRFYKRVHKGLSHYVDSIQNSTSKKGDRAGELAGVYMFMCDMLRYLHLCTYRTVHACNFVFIHFE